MPRIKGEHTETVWSRVDAIVVLILENQSYLGTKRNKELTTLVMKKFGIGTRSAQKHISIAKRELRKLGQEERKSAFLKAMQDRQFLIEKLKSALSIIEDKKNATKKGRSSRVETLYKLLEVFKDRDRLLGLYTEQMQHTGTISLKNLNYSKLTDEQLKTLKQKIRSGDDFEKYLIGLVG